MADWYLRSSDGVDDVGAHTNFLDAFATLKYALTQMAAGDTLYVSDNHAESTAATISLSSPGTAAAPVRVLCVDDTSDVAGALATTATVTVTGIHNDFSFPSGAITYFYGLTFVLPDGQAVMGFGAGNGSDQALVLEQCHLNMGASSNDIGRTILGDSLNSDVFVKLIDTNITLGQHSSYDIEANCGRFEWIGGSLLTNAPSRLITFSAPSNRGQAASVLVRDVDLSIMGASTSLSNGAGNTNDCTFINCKLGASVALSQGGHKSAGGSRSMMINCDSGDTNNRSAFESYEGSVVSDTTTYVTTGGASSGASNPMSWLMTANSGKVSPTISQLHSPWIGAWLDTAGTYTFEVEILYDSATNLQDDEVWLEVEYAVNATFPLGDVKSDRMADILSTPADQAAGAGIGTWTKGTPAVGWISNKLTVSGVVVADKGAWRARVALASAANPVYVNPKVAVT